MPVTTEMAFHYGAIQVGRAKYDAYPSRSEDGGPWKPTTELLDRACLHEIVVVRSISRLEI